MTANKTEAKLKSALEARRLPHRYGVKIGHYEVDFVLGDHLVVEVDGYHHLSRPQRRRDRRKTAYLQRLGYDVHRIAARRVWIADELKVFVDHLDHCLQQFSSPSSDQADETLTEDQKTALEEMKKALTDESSGPGDPEQDPRQEMQRHLDKHFPRRRN